MKNFFRIICLLVSFFASIHLTYAQSPTPSDTLNPARLRTVILAESAFYVAGLSYLQFVWYQDHEPVPFHWYNDNGGWLQLDKAGHMYAAYFESAIGYHSLRWAGVNRRKSLIYGGMLGLVLQTPIEIFDGLYEGYGFSWGDMEHGRFATVHGTGRPFGSTSSAYEILVCTFCIREVPPVGTGRYTGRTLFSGLQRAHLLAIGQPTFPFSLLVAAALAQCRPRLQWQWYAVRIQ